MDFFIVGIILAIIFIVLINYVFFYDRKKFRYRKNLPPRQKIPAAVPSAKPGEVVPATIPSFIPGEFMYAGFFRRLAAYMIDLIIIYFISFSLVILMIIRNIDPNIAAAFFVIVIYPIFVLYFAVFDAGLGKLNATPGKKLLSIVVVDNEFQQVSFRKSLLRGFLKSFLGIFGVFIPFSRNRRALWDMIVKTSVIFDPNKEWVNNRNS
jgi:uncharacterized RDD family membrane protein YckC